MIDVDKTLIVMRVQLFAAMQTFKGDDLLKFKQLLFDVVQCLPGAADFRQRLEACEPFLEESP